MKTLWGDGAGLDPKVAAYTAGEDRALDARLLRWDVLGSLAHAEGLRAAKLLTEREHARLRAALRRALAESDLGRFKIGTHDEDGHTALERRLVGKLGAVGEKIHTGRSRNDQVLAALRLFAKDSILATGIATLDAADAFVAFGRDHRTVLFPGYTHQRRAMPSTVALWASAFAEGLLDSLGPVEAALDLLDRSPLGSAAGYGVPLPHDRARVAKALGFASVQPSRGKTEALAVAALWGIARELSAFSFDVILFTSEEYGYLRLPSRLATGSSIMPQKKNPDLFELTRAREGVLAGCLAEIVAVSGKLPSGYHRDLQFTKGPFLRALDAARGMTERIAGAIPLLEVDRERCALATTGDVLATDAAYALVRDGVPFRSAYRAVAGDVARGDAFVEPTPGEVLNARRRPGEAGDPALGPLAREIASARRKWTARRAKFDRALTLLAGKKR